jgi:alpha-D-xyloside xylohydrolase
MGLVDFTNPDAVSWYTECLNGLFDKGVDCIKTDFGERIPALDVEWFDKSADPERMHVSPYRENTLTPPGHNEKLTKMPQNYYAFLYNQTVYNALSARYGPSQAVLFARSACAGTQRFPVVWGGDSESTPEAMAESVRGGLSLGLCGYAFWSNDIGGFEGLPAPWIYKRWVAFGLLCSHSRLHGSSSYRVPWLIDGDDDSEEGCSRVLARWTALKARLMPYLLAQAAMAVENGWPLSLRAMCLEFPDDPTAWFLDRQFMVGESLLAAPVFEESGEVQFYLPKGKWTCLFTNRVREGPGWFRERHGFASTPLYVRENTVLIMGKAGIRGAVYDYASDVEVALYHVRDGACGKIVNSEGKVAGSLSVDAEGRLKGTEGFTGSFTKSVDGRKVQDDFLDTIEWLE